MRDSWDTINLMSDFFLIMDAVILILFNCPSKISTATSFLLFLMPDDGEEHFHLAFADIFFLVDSLLLLCHFVSVLTRGQPRPIYFH